MRHLSLRKYRKHIATIALKITRRQWGVIIASLVAVFLFSGIYAGNSYYFHSSRSLKNNTTLIIPRGASFSSIVNDLIKADIINHSPLFSFNVRVRDKHRFLKAGEYFFPAGITPKEVMKTLLEGKTVLHKITIPEGITTMQIMDILNEENRLTNTVDSPITEGMLLPETYYFSYGDSREDIVGRMRERMENALQELWPKRQEGLPIATAEEALVLASIVEKETSRDSERGRVAAVFINRLRKNMRLQSDPTVIYAVTQGKVLLGRPLSRKDLKTESPFNTYVSSGLPPHPIAHPGRASIVAVLNPPATKELYFVASGNGGHNFATNLRDHNKNVRLFRRKQRGR